MSDGRYDLFDLAVPPNPRPLSSECFHRETGPCRGLVGRSVR